MNRKLINVLNNKRIIKICLKQGRQRWQNVEKKLKRKLRKKQKKEEEKDSFLFN